MVARAEATTQGDATPGLNHCGPPERPVGESLRVVDHHRVRDDGTPVLCAQAGETSGFDQDVLEGQLGVFAHARARTRSAHRQVAQACDRLLVGVEDTRVAIGGRGLQPRTGRASAPEDRVVRERRVHGVRTDRHGEDLAAARSTERRIEAAMR
jgi:hypothetical protein